MTHRLLPDARSLKLLLGVYREVLVGAATHPIAAATWRIGNDTDFPTSLAMRAAAKAYRLSRRLRFDDSEIIALDDLRAHLTEEGMAWSKWDPSGMTFVKGPLLYFLIRLAKPRTVVETGVASGISSSYILHGLRANNRGTLISIDLPNADPDAPVPSARASGWLVPAGLRARWTLKIGDARSVLPGVLEESREIDMFFHDSLHTYSHMTWEYEEAWHHMRPAGVLVSDDVDANTAFVDFCRRLKVTPRTHMGLGIAAKPKAGP